MCQTPGCTKIDFHDGAHSYETCLPVRVTKGEIKVAPKDTKEGNRFIYDIGFVRRAIEDQHGIKVRVPCEFHPVNKNTDSFNMTVCGPMHEGHAVLFGVDDEGHHVTLKYDDLVRYDVNPPWKPPSEATLARHQASFVGKEHDAAAQRTEFSVKVLRDNIRTVKTQNCASVDGHGANREAYYRGFADLPALQTPGFRTFEINPIPALSQQLLYDSATVTYTGADYPFGYGCDGARLSTPAGIEYLLTTKKDTAGRRNRLVSDEYRENLVMLILDYCGGILGGLDFEEAQRTLFNLLARLPRLVVLCLTFGKRQRPGVKHEFEKYGPTPYGFRVVHTFDAPTDNQRVVSRTFVRDFAIPRTLNVPGMMWHHTESKSCSTSSRMNTWKCVVKSFEPQTGAYILYSIVDDADNQVFRDLSIDDLQQWAVVDDCARVQPDTQERDIACMEKIIHAAKLDLQRMRKKMNSSRSIIQKQKTTYHCRACGMPKKGHVCTAR